ncbi:hypothetical protein EOI86_22670 [Hwanghaeella grinnelliae]|uniref:Uncharacterized protein n=1 Tax=Hwanghaeella grinnelliae TaxID=2500179 RepID=A0A437QH95_9PROT|nr:hypothetical protein [Hwanghaeella grinnelliae]RVU33935.1 hypothetical protein EOI86_22670 [Hwanghaeella grinnelliae]
MINLPRMLLKLIRDDSRIHTSTEPCHIKGDIFRHFSRVESIVTLQAPSTLPHHEMRMLRKAASFAYGAMEMTEIIWPLNRLNRDWLGKPPETEKPDN